MKILVLSEGKHELGGEGPDGSVASPLETLVRRLYGVEAEVERCRFGSQEFGNALLSIRPGKGHNLTKRATAWMRLAQQQGFDAIVAVVDHDGFPDRVVAFDAAQEEGGIALRRAFGIAIRTFDAWMLADAKALSTALGRTIQTQSAPEALDDPKSVCRRLLDDCGLDASLAELYAEIAQSVRIAELEQRCRKGFAERVNTFETLAGGI
jgi:hypothetical protein